MSQKVEPTGTDVFNAATVKELSGQCFRIQNSNNRMQNFCGCCIQITCNGIVSLYSPQLCDSLTGNDKPIKKCQK